MSDLPREITEQILFRLPVRSLVRLSLVCKQWRSLVSDPIFVRDHTHRVLLDHPEVVIYAKPDPWRNSIILKTVDYESLNSTNFQLKFRDSAALDILCCCNGLWLIDRYNSNSLTDHPTHVLWNPLLGQNYKVLPQSKFGSSYRRFFDGFGYAPSHDYKVVRLCRKISGSYYPRCYSELQVEVYSLKADSWKIIPGVPPTNIEFNDNSANEGTHVDGSIYWNIYHLQNAAVIAFDLTTEKFKFLETPFLDDYDYVCRISIVNIVQVRERLGAFRTGCDCLDAVIWIWNEDENKEGYWTKLLAIPRKYHSFTRVLSFLNNNQVLLHVSEVGLQKLVVYDSACMMFRDIHCGNVGWPVHTVETLVSPNSF